MPLQYPTCAGFSNLIYVGGGYVPEPGTYIYDGGVVIVRGSNIAYVTVDGLPATEWVKERARESAVAMMAEQARRLYANPAAGLGPWPEIENFNGYYCISWAFITNGLYAAMSPSKAPHQFLYPWTQSPMGIPVYTQERLALDAHAARLKALQDTEAAALDKLKLQFSPAQLVALSADTATDPISSRLIQTLLAQLAINSPAMLTELIAPALAKPIAEIDPTFAKAAEIPIPAGAREMLDLPLIADNARTQQTQREIELANALTGATPQEQTAIRAGLVAATIGQYLDDPLNANPVSRRLAERLASGARFAAYKAKAPSVTFQAQDNPDIDFWTWKTPWETTCARAGSCATAPPLVILNIMPRQMNLPKSNFWEKNSKWLAPVLSAVPFVGPALGAITAYVGSQSASRRAQFNIQAAINSVTADAFEPSYFPRDFTIALPLNLAQEAVKEPAYVVPLYEYYTRKEVQQAVQQDFWKRNAWLTQSGLLPPSVAA
jgi:hypothetical protein